MIEMIPSGGRFDFRDVFSGQEIGVDMLEIRTPETRALLRGQTRALKAGFYAKTALNIARARFKALHGRDIAIDGVSMHRAMRARPRASDDPEPLRFIHIEDQLYEAQRQALADLLKPGFTA